MPWRVTLATVRRGADDASTQTFHCEEIVVGRSPPADLVLAHANVSRRHCAFRIQADGTVMLADLGSSNGTFVNGERVREHAFEVGDELMLGDHVVRLVEQPQRVETR